ncbi:FadR family transcriptional regulator [Alsobacter sp. SYSU M60028]|uniref:FadR family transcriptional regulator n=1 Tax=Alsobacter ponti TaxID=2962936 RepID=A0ABT1L7G5_9HYPH|nr:FadR/GntR family transcriptional regulator [Alsobacter ponti]MCP8937409.1 FadR family transcriptional regulator [Alsobacter ponti]
MKVTGQAPEKRSNLHLNVASALGSRIVGGEFPVGQLIPTEAELGASFGVSRTVVREAVKLLVSKGLLRTGSGIGTWVPDVSEWNFLDPMVFAWVQASENSEAVIRQLFAFRSAVEPAAAAEAARNATVAQLYAIESALETMSSAKDDFAQWIEGDVAFHTAIYIASNNVFMAPLANVFRQYFQMSFRVSSSNQHHQHCLQEHYDVFKAIRDRKPEKASRAVKVLLENANADACEVLAEAHRTN